MLRRKNFHSSRWHDTTTSCSVKPAPTLCGNQGLAFAVYDNQAGPNDYNGYPQFDPTVYKTAPVYGQGVTTTIGGFDLSSDPIDIYGQVVHSLELFVVNHQGYIYAEETGTYTITVSNVDDAVFFWISSTAYSGWTRDNVYTNAVIYYDNPNQATVQLDAGTYTAIRVMFAQGAGPVAFSVDITMPDGSDFLGPDSGASQYVV